jgi:phosphoglycolate phosphatase-like HAD superfamily hydrolase
VARQKIALDADGVLLDYNSAYARAWQRAFGAFPKEIDAKAYWPMGRWEVERLSGARLEHLRKQFDQEFWSTIPAIDGAVEATHALHDAGYELVCVTALEPAFESARLRNLRKLGYPIERVIATSRSADSSNPKVAALAELQPVAFVDDFLPFLMALPDTVHTALLRGHATGSPNQGPGVELVRSHHRDLAEFAAWWGAHR